MDQTHRYVAGCNAVFFSDPNPNTSMDTMSHSFFVFLETGATVSEPYAAFCTIKLILIAKQRKLLYFCDGQKNSKQNDFCLNEFPLFQIKTYLCILRPKCNIKRVVVETQKIFLKSVAVDFLV